MIVFMFGFVFAIVSDCTPASASFLYSIQLNSIDIHVGFALLSGSFSSLHLC